MLTKWTWEELLSDVDIIKKRDFRYSSVGTYERKRELTIASIFLVVLTPILILVDLITSPLQLIYLIVYKLLWKD